MNLSEDDIKRLAGQVVGEMRLLSFGAGSKNNDSIQFQFAQIENDPYLAMDAKIWTADGFLFIDIGEDAIDIHLGINSDGLFFVQVNDKEVYVQPTSDN